MNLRELFPEAVVNQKEEMGQGWLSQPLGDQFIHFPLESLSQREQALLDLQEPQSALQVSGEDAWHQFLVQKKGGPSLLYPAQEVAGFLRQCEHHQFCTARQSLY